MDIDSFDGQANLTRVEKGESGDLDGYAVRANSQND
jgi:hypothetical protein